VDGVKVSISDSKDYLLTKPPNTKGAISTPLLQRGDAHQPFDGDSIMKDRDQKKIQSTI
jgi:hypothetical protein